jgi:hypothetical protein
MNEEDCGTSGLRDGATTCDEAIVGCCSTISRSQSSDCLSHSVSNTSIFDHKVEQAELIPAATICMHHFCGVVEEVESSERDADGTRHSFVPGMHPRTPSARDDETSNSAIADRCECFDWRDSDWSDNFLHLRDNVTSGHVTHVICRRCGRALPTDDGNCYVGIGCRRRASVILRPEALRLGDHVTWTRAINGIPYRHGIVVGVDAAHGNVRLVSFQRKPRGAIYERLGDNGKINEPLTYGQVREVLLLLAGTYNFQNNLHNLIGFDGNGKAAGEL